MARLLLGVASALLVAAAQGQQVTLRGGVFKGETLEAGGDRQVFSFRGIPYARPPVGHLRFKDPEPSEPWEGTKESYDPPMCPQLSFEALFGGEVNVTGDEDCLYLHVYTPQLCRAEPLPVMVFLHGGGFLLGSPDWAGSSPLLTRDLVLVLPQYRLGTLGFLSTGDGVIPGNMGLKDQTLALHWVQDNIRSFGGDPERVTIFGVSAGGASVHFQMLMLKAEGLFQRAIMQSGSAISPWAVRMDDPKRAAAGVARQVGCTGVEDDGKVDSEALLTCLQDVPAKDLVLTSTQGETWNNFPFYMAPRVDGDYLPAHPAQLLREGRYNKVDVISGVCRHEGASFVVGDGDTCQLHSSLGSAERQGQWVTRVSVDNSAMAEGRVTFGGGRASRRRPIRSLENDFVREDAEGTRGNHSARGLTAIPVRPPLQPLQAEQNRSVGSMEHSAETGRSRRKDSSKPTKQKPSASSSTASPVHPPLHPQQAKPDRPVVSDQHKDEKVRPLRKDAKPGKQKPSGTILPASPPRLPLQVKADSTRNSVAAPLPSSLAVPVPSTSGHTSTVRPRLRQAVTPSKYFKMLFPEDDDDDDRGSDSESDSTEYGWPSDFSLESSSSSEEEEPLLAAENRELHEGEDVEERQAPVREPAGYSFSWSEGSDFIPHLHEFRSDRSGITNDWPCTDEARESDFFRAFLDNEVMSFIADKTNTYYRWVSQRMDVIAPRSRMRQWVDTTPRELMVFFALMLLMPLCKKHLLQHYWRNDPLLNTPLFKKYMTRDRFLLLLSFLFFTEMENYSRNDRIWQVREILPMFLSRYKKYFSPFQKMVIDESLLLYKGRLVFKQYIPTKRHRFGIKLFVLCDCETGIVLDMVVYTGTDVDIPKVSKSDPLGMSGAVIKKMMAPYMGKGHILYTDNWFTSPALCQFLHDNSTGLCGTARTNRRLMPKFNVQKARIDNPSSDDTEQENNEEAQEDRRRKKRKKKNRFVQKEKSGKVLALKWDDKRAVHMLTTVHKGEIVNSGKKHHRTKKAIMKPDAVLDYTKNMRLVDKSDSQISGIECLRKSTMWYQKFFFHMIDITMLNAYNFWLVKVEMEPTKKIKLREFIYNVVFQLLEELGQPRSTIQGPRHTLQPDRIVEGYDRHYPVHTELVNGEKRRLECYVCKHTTRRPRKRTRVTIKCYECDTPLCAINCFKDYHTLKNF